jgi:hypothetical protein
VKGIGPPVNANNAWKEIQLKAEVKVMSIDWKGFLTYILLSIPMWYMAIQIPIGFLTIPSLVVFGLYLYSIGKLVPPSP